MSASYHCWIDSKLVSLTPQRVGDLGYRACVYDAGIVQQDVDVVAERVSAIYLVRGVELDHLKLDACVLSLLVQLPHLRLDLHTGDDPVAPLCETETESEARARAGDEE